MILAGSVVINVFSIVLLVVIYHHSLKDKERWRLHDKIYLTVLQITFAMLLIDTMSRFDGRPETIYPIVNHIGNFLIFLLSPVVPSLWLAYVHLQIYRDERRSRRVFYPLVAVNLANAAATLITLSSGWYYSIDSRNIYHRGPLFLVCAAITMMLILYALGLTIVNRRAIDRKRYLSLLFFPVPPFVGIVIQTAFYGVSLILNGLVLSLLVVFLNVQSDTLLTDYLTGVGNRKRLESYIEERISACTEGRTFSGILIDLDNFKSINDKFGHGAGDRALQISAQMLKSCLRSDDFIARFGGDEFCIILNTSSCTDLEAIVRRIRDRFDSYSRAGDQSYTLRLSMGYAVYDFREHLNADEFQRRIDVLMYEDKHGPASAAQMKGERGDALR